MLDPAEFRDLVIRCHNMVDPEDNNTWPHKLVFCQWIALASAQGPLHSTDNIHRSIFVPGVLCFDAVYSMLDSSDAFKYKFRDLI